MISQGARGGKGLLTDISHKSLRVFLTSLITHIFSHSARVFIELNNTALHNTYGNMKTYVFFVFGKSLTFTNLSINVCFLY